MIRNTSHRSWQHSCIFPGQMARQKGHDLQQRQGTMLQGQASSGFFRSSTGIQGKFSGKEKSEGNNSTKIDNPIFGVLHPASQVTCFACHRPGHFQAGCKPPPFCLINRSEGHLTVDDNNRAPPSVLKKFGLGIPGGGFFGMVGGSNLVVATPLQECCGDLCA